MKWTGLSVNSFALSIGLNRGENLYQIKRGNNGISRELAGMISTKYPQISRAWLLAGEGDMFTDDTLKHVSVPFYDVDVEKYVTAPHKFASRGYVSLPTVEDADFGALYNGRAMEGSIPAGSMVLVCRVEPEGLIPGGNYVVVTDGFVMLRRVRRDVESGQLRLMPSDVDNFDEIRIDPALVRELYAVRATVIRNF